MVTATILSKMVHMEESTVANFDMCQLGHQQKGPMRMITNFMQVAKRISKRCEYYSKITNEKLNKDKFEGARKEEMK